MHAMTVRSGKWMKVLLISGLLALLLVPVPIVIAQNATPATTNGTQAGAKAGTRNLFSLWIKMSLIGYSQSEIESALMGKVEPAQLKRVKHRLRINVINNLRNQNLRDDILNSSTVQDLRIIQEKVRTEVRFAGLENDSHLRMLIRRHFGVRVHYS